MEILADSSLNPALLISVLFPFFFVGLWCLVCFILSRVGGWHGLGEKFTAGLVPEGTVLRAQSAQFSGFCNYNRCLTIVIAHEGLYLRIWPIFRLGHPPLLIPWAEIRNSRESSFLWVRKASFDIGDPRIARISVSQKTFELFPKHAEPKEESQLPLP